MDHITNIVNNRKGMHVGMRSLVHKDGELFDSQLNR